MDLFRLLRQNSDSEEEEQPLLEHENGSEQNDSEDEQGEVEVENSCQARDDKMEASSSRKERKKNKKVKTEFDISLPARHLYLGELEEDGPANMEDEETTPTLPLLCIPSRIIFPGETLPMLINNPHMIQMLRDASTRNKPVAVCTDLRLRHAPDHLVRPTQEELSEIGTTAEVVAFREEESQYFYGQNFVVKFLGRQRFRLLQLHKRVNGLMDCQVKILPEQYLPPRPLHIFPCPAHVYASYHATQLMARQPECSIHTCTQLKDTRKRMRHPYLNGSFSSVPSWVFSQFDIDYLREQIMMEQELKTFQSEYSKSAKLPSDVSSLSYWLARRLPTDEKGKLQLLSIDCPTLRLIRGLQILKEFTDLCCIDCQSFITKKSYMFSMSVDGPLAAYVNPGGFVHDTLTVMETKGLRKQGRASTEHSWFPGYKWTILSCRNCGNHKGWCFETTKKDTVPAKFYGLTRAGLVLTAVNSEPKKDSGQMSDN